MQYPFSALVGFSDLQLALLLCAVEPRIGGVLLTGERGTAKTTAVRALADVMPPIQVVPGCRFSCDPNRPDPSCPDTASHQAGSVDRPTSSVEIPLSATEERLTGTIDIAEVLSHGHTRYAPGLLAAAHRGVLYVDEINLLPDHLVDGLLDAAATGRARCERDHVSVTHAARFVLAGSMNPEEGELRPQLLDRFGLSVVVGAPIDTAARGAIVRRRLEFDSDPVAFAASYADKQAQLRDQIVRATKLLPNVSLPEDMLDHITNMCAHIGIDGVRADVVIARTAVAHAAWHGRGAVSSTDIAVAARLALPHRLRRNPFDDPDGGQPWEEFLPPEGGTDTEPQTSPDTDAQECNAAPPHASPAATEQTPAPTAATDTPASEHQSQANQAAPSRNTTPPADGGTPTGGQPVAGQLQISSAPQRRLPLHLTQAAPGGGAHAGRSHGGRTRGRSRPVDQQTGEQPWDPIATVLSALPWAWQRRARGSNALPLTGSDIRYREITGTQRQLTVVCADASGSVGSRHAVNIASDLLSGVLHQSYTRRDRVALVTFAADRGQVTVAPTSSPHRLHRELSTLRFGGKTPLAQGIRTAQEVLLHERRKGHDAATVVLVTDGRATGAPDALQQARTALSELVTTGVQCVVLDCEPNRPGKVRLGLARDLAERSGATYFDLNPNRHVRKAA